MALQSRSFSDLITYTRTGVGTYHDSAGVLQSAAANTPRFDHDPVTLAAKGLLIEESRTNLLTYSEDFDNSAWTKAALTIAPNATVAPDGTARADKLVEDTTTTFRQVSSFPTLTAVAHTFSFYAKAAERNWIRIVCVDGAAYINLSDGSVGITTAGAVSFSVLTPQDVGDGWYRVAGVFTATAGGNTVAVRLAQSNGGQSYTGDGTSGVYIWGAQLEAGAFPTSYVPTTPSFTSRASTATYYGSAGVIQSAAVDEARDAAYLPVGGVFYPAGLLLEAAGTNVCLRSEEFDNASWGKINSTVTANAIAAPDGTMTADKVEETTSVSSVFVAQSASLAATTVYTFSVYAKAGERSRLLLRENTASGFFASFDLSAGAKLSKTASSFVASEIQDVGNGWYRCSMTWENVSAASRQMGIYLLDDSGVDFGDVTYSGTSPNGIYLWGAQIEAGSYATSYIPTTTATVTRSADVSSSAAATRGADNASITGTNFSDFFNATEGTVFVQASTNTPAASRVSERLIEFSDGSTSERMAILQTPSPLVQFLVTDGGATQAALSISGADPSTTIKAAAAFKLNDVAFCIDGGAVSTDTSATIPTPDRLFIGSQFDGLLQLNGHIRDVRFYPSRLSDAQLQELTS